MTEPKWTREDVQSVLYHIIKTYEQAQDVNYIEIRNSVAHVKRKTPRRFIVCGQRMPFLGGDSELLRNAIRIGVETLKDNHWWPDA